MLGRSSAGAVLATLAVTLASACGGSSPPTPSPGNSNGDSITGRERLGWDQKAADAAELASFRYAIYVDGARSEMADVSCATTPSAAGYGCSGRMPSLTNGVHLLEMAAFLDAGSVIEETRSSPLRVTVTGAAADAAAAMVADGDIITTDDGVRLRAELIYDGLDQPSAMALAPDGRVLIGTRTGALTIVSTDRTVTPVSVDAAPIFSIALSPTFASDRHLYLAQAVSSDTGPSFRTARYRLMGHRTSERMVILENGPVARDGAAALHFGTDGKLYAAFDNGESVEAGERMSDRSGKILRMEPDGHTPADQAAASPVYWRGLSAPRGLDSADDGSTLWVADRSADGSERLRVIEVAGEQPRRAAQRGTFRLPDGLGASALAFHRGGSLPEFAGDLLVAGRGNGYILRIRFEKADATRPANTERLLEGKVGTVRALAIGTDGAIYFCTDKALVRLVRARP
ncbi:MAG: PQQ-dependent sugar dehydrogenase [Vicinamibacterales bacterium]